MKGGVIGIGVYRRRSNREEIIDENQNKSWRKDRSLRNTTIYRFIGRTVAVYNSCYRTTGKEIREKVTDRRIDSERGKFWKSKLCARLYRRLLICLAPQRNSPKPRRAEDQESESRE